MGGWLASYYLGGYHRGLEVARLTGDYYLRRIFGDHGLTGRRLYLSVWNLAELYDATKDEAYLTELQDRVDRLLELQKKQGGRMVIDRYGYSQNYVSHGLSKYLQMFDDREVELAVIDHAQSLLQNPPFDHEMESYLASIHALLMGYDLIGADAYLAEACRRAVHLRTDEAPRPIASYETQGALIRQMERVSNLPGRGQGPAVGSGRPPVWAFSNGLRIFGWTHAYGVPYLIDRLESAELHRDELPCMRRELDDVRPVRVGQRVDILPVRSLPPLRDSRLGPERGVGNVQRLEHSILMDARNRRRARWLRSVINRVLN